MASSSAARLALLRACCCAAALLLPAPCRGAGEAEGAVARELAALSLRALPFHFGMEAGAAGDVVAKLPADDIPEGEKGEEEREIDVEGAFDCASGFNNWRAGWSPGKKRWCCKHHDAGCPVGPLRNEQMELHFNCSAGALQWWAAWSSEKKEWCCMKNASLCDDPSKAPQEQNPDGALQSSARQKVQKVLNGSIPKQNASPPTARPSPKAGAGSFRDATLKASVTAVANPRGGAAEASAAAGGSSSAAAAAPAGSSADAEDTDDNGSGNATLKAAVAAVDDPSSGGGVASAALARGNLTAAASAASGAGAEGAQEPSVPVEEALEALKAAEPADGAPPQQHAGAAGGRPGSGQEGGQPASTGPAAEPGKQNETSGNTTSSSHGAGASTSKRPDWFQGAPPWESGKSSGSGSLRLPSVTSFDPLKAISNLAITLVVVALLLLLWKFREQVLILATGDGRIHGSLPDGVWWCCFRCCGTCDHEWTRWLTNCSYCPRQLRGANLVRLLGSLFGVSTVTVELSNVVVGDLPSFGRGDFYLRVDCAANPPMMTSLALSKWPKVVHFPDVLTLKLRSSYFEHRVRITVRQEHIVGSRDLCYVEFPAMNVLDWSRSQGGSDSAQGGPLKRFAMRPSDHHEEVETPPWIALEFSRPVRDYRRLDQITPNMVRTATWPRLDQRTGEYFSEMSIANVKKTYQLVDEHGHAVREPREDDLASLHRFRECCHFISSCFTLWTLLGIAVYVVLRLYSWSCYTHFYHLTIATLLRPPIKFPISSGQLQDVADVCHDRFAGMHWCKPNATQVTAVCKDLPPSQPRPSCFPLQLQESLGGFRGLPCFEGVCDAHAWLRNWDFFVGFGAFILLVSHCWCCRSCIKGAVDRRKRAVMQAENDSESLLVRSRRKGTCSF